MLKKNDLENVLDFVLRIQNIEDDFRNNVLQTISEIFGYKYLTFFLSDSNLCLKHPVSTNNLSHTLNSYTQYYFNTDIFHYNNIPKHLLSHSVVKITDIMSIQKFQKTEYFNDFLRKYSLHHQVILPLNVDNNNLGVIAVLKSKDMNDFNNDEIILLNKINRYIAQNLKIYLDINRLRKEDYIYKNCSYTLPIGLMVLDSNFSLFYLNENAKLYCSKICEAEKINNRINNKPVQNIINLLTNHLLTNFVAQNKEFKIKISSYCIQVLPFMIPDNFNNIETIYAVYISNSYEYKSLNDNNEVFNKLTKREIEIINLISKGCTNKKIADTLYLSNHTVKTHIQNIYSKMEVNNRTSLMYKLNNINLIGVYN